MNFLTATLVVEHIRLFVGLRVKSDFLLLGVTLVLSFFTFSHDGQVAVQSHGDWSCPSYCPIVLTVTAVTPAFG
jgi:hypothetical protein